MDEELKDVQTSLVKLDESKIGEIIEKGLMGDAVALSIAINLILETKSKKIFKALMVPKKRNWDLLERFELYLSFAEGVEFLNIVLDEGITAGEMYLSQCFINKYKKEKYSVNDTRNIIAAFTKEVEEILRK